MNPSSSSLSLSSCSSSKRKRDQDSLDEPSCKRPKYDLFVNYSFEDIGKSFVSHVHGALLRNGLTISDHTNLPVGQEVCSELLRAIQESEIFVLVFSKKYASSVRCLNELVHIMNCKSKKKLFPVFFKVDPSDVRNQEGPFKKAFKAHKINFDHKRVQKWRKALNDAGRLSGQHYKYGDEESFIRKIVKKLKTMQSPQELYVPDHLVGIDSRVEELISSLSLDLEDVSIVAVFGISGIGKTTIAAATFNRIAGKFDSSCFLGGIYYYDSGSQTSMVDLQKLLISGLSQNDKLPMIQNNLEGVSKIIKITSSRKVLLVLDDVANFDQLKALGINPKFFQAGSRIIVTTRDKQSLGSLSYVSYNTSLLNEMESIELFTRLTYKQNEPIDTHLVNKIAYYSSGLPLVLEVWSRHFRLIEKRDLWPNVLKTLKAIPLDDVQKKLKISYDSLTNRAKKLFLDIACVFDGMFMESTVKPLQDEESSFFPDIEIQCLADRGLVLIGYGNRDILHMHDAIREMGQEIVRQENEDEPGQRTRLMNHKDVLRVLKEFSGTHTVESIYQRNMTGHIDAFRKMTNLRLIRLYKVSLCSDPRNPFGCDCEGMSPLSFPKLKYLEWENFPMESINIDMCNVVVVKLQWSGLRTLWKRPKVLEKLKILDVSDSSSLTKTGNFIGLENLEYLHLNNCANLEELDNSVWCLSKLVKLNLGNCKRLTRFSLKMELGKFRCPQELDLSGCVSIGFEDDEVIKHFMSSLKETNITSLNLEGCKIRKVPSEIGSLVSLKHFNLSENDFCSLPDCLVQLVQLETIHLSYCSSLQSIPYLPQSICEVTARQCVCLRTLPSNMAELTSLRILDLMNCICLTSLPSSMTELTSLEDLQLNGCSKLGIEDPECVMKLTGLTRLEILDMRYCNVSQVPSEIGNLVSLHTLYLDGNTFCTLPDSFANLLKLRDLSIWDCSKLTSLPLLPPSLTNIYASGCKSMDVMRSASGVIDEFYGRCPTPAALNMTNFPYYNFSKCILAAYREASFLSRLQIHVSDDEEEEFPIWCHNVFGSNSQAEFMASQHLDERKICGIILCLRSGYGDAELQNKTKGTSCCLTKVDQGPFLHKLMCIMFYPLDNTTLMVEAGDSLAIHFQGRGSLGCGVCLIYKEGDEMEVEPTTNPFNFNPIPNHVNSP